MPMGCLCLVTNSLVLVMSSTSLDEWKIPLKSHVHTREAFRALHVGRRKFEDSLPAPVSHHVRPPSGRPHRRPSPNPSRPAPCRLHPTGRTTSLRRRCSRPRRRMDDRLGRKQPPRAMHDAVSRPPRPPPPWSKLARRAKHLANHGHLPPPGL
jgi:hypothetical protein